MLLPQLVGLRALAVTGVLLCHTRQIVPDGVFRRLLFDMNQGVPAFFVLSGFVLGVNYLAIGAKPMSLRDFYLARFARIYPMYVASAALAAPTYLLNLHRETQAWLLKGTAVTVAIYLAFLQPFFGPRAMDLNGPSWTLPVEVLFYLLFPWIGRWAFRSAHRAPLLTVSGLWMLSLGAFYVGYAAKHQLELLGVSAERAEQLRTLFPPQYLPMLTLGAAGAGLLNSTSATQFLQVVRARYWLFVAGALFVIASLSGALATEIGRQSFLLVCFVTVVHLAQSDSRDWLTSRAMMRVGEASYSIYILHVPVFRICDLVCAHVSFLRDDLAVCGLLKLGAALSVGVLASVLLESPARNWIRRRFVQRRTDGAYAN